MRGRDVLRVLIAMTSVLSRIVFCTSVSAPLHLPLGGLSGHFGGGHSGDGVGAGVGGKEGHTHSRCDPRSLEKREGHR